MSQCSVGDFCVNVLAADQLAVCEKFAVSGGNKFEDVDWAMSRSAHPSIDGCLAHIECSIEEVHEAGDHDIVIGRVQDLRIGRPGLPLLFYQGTYARLSS
jgi:flavin reductase (DIM6/NTAB) family NADH-FMN oxidoreductase RutF